MMDSHIASDGQAFLFCRAHHGDRFARGQAAQMDARSRLARARALEDGTRFVEAARMIPNALFGALFPALAALVAQPDGSVITSVTTAIFTGVRMSCRA